MGTTKYAIGLTALALGVWSHSVGISSGQQADPPAEQPPGVEVQTRGPVHEAYAEPVTPKPRPAPIVPKKPPEPVNEVPPDQKPEGANVQWIPGYWAWDDEAADFLWVSGVWRNFPPGYQWVPGYWAEATGGSQWVPGYWAEQGQQEAQFLPGPPQSIDAGPSSPSPGEDSSYVPGCWIWRETRYAWRPGFWVTYQPGYVWVAACYRWTPSGYIFIDGHWDYMLRHRGLLFAPVLFSGQGYTDPSFSYTPSYVISTSALVNALFVRSDYCSYYFGDYFDPSYQGHGFVPWFDYRVGRAAYDPLYSYYRWHFRHNNDWDRSLRGLYSRRRSGEAPRPPHTLAQQNTIVQNIRNSKVTDVNNVLRSVTMTVPMAKVDQSVVKLQKIPPQQLAAERKTVEQSRRLGLDRQKAEHELIGNGAAPTTARTTKLALPQSTAPAKEGKQQAPGLKAPPPAPKVPQHEERAVPKHEPEKPMILPKEPRQAPKSPEPHPGTKQPAPSEAQSPKANPKQPAVSPQPQPKEPPKQPELVPHPAPKGQSAPKQPEPAPAPKGQPAPKQAEPAPHPAPAPKQPEPAPQPKAAPPAPHPAPAQPKEKNGKE